MTLKGTTMSTGLERARERAGHYHQDVVLQRGIAAAVHEIDEQRHRADKAEAALALLSQSVMPLVKSRGKSDREVTNGLADVLAAEFAKSRVFGRDWVATARVAIDYLESEGVIA